MRKIISAVNWEVALTILYALVGVAAVVAMMFERQLMGAFQ